MKSKCLCVVLTILLVISGGSINAKTTEAVSGYAKNLFKKRTYAVQKGKKIKIVIRGVKKKLKWSADNKKYISVKATGKYSQIVFITGIKIGNVKLTVTSEKKKEVCTIKVGSDKEIWPGTHSVGKDAKPGIYKVKAVSTKYQAVIERKGDVGNQKNKVIQKVSFPYGQSAYVEILSTDKSVKVSRAKLIPVNLNAYKPKVVATGKDGIYLVGKDINPGRYKVVKSTSSPGSFDRVCNLLGESSSSLSWICIDNTKEIEVYPTDFAVKVSGCQFTFIGKLS